LRVGAAKPAFALQIFMEVSPNTVHVGEERLVGFYLGQPLLLDPAQHEPGIVIGLLPEIGVDAAKELDGGMVPRPAKVQGKVVETTQSLRKAGRNVKLMYSRHENVFSVQLYSLPEEAPAGIGEARRDNIYRITRNHVGLTYDIRDKSKALTKHMID